MSSNKDDIWHTKEFSWQEKCFCIYGKDFFNQSSDTEQDIKKNTDVPSKSDGTDFLFTYIDGDEYVLEKEVKDERTLLIHYYQQKHLSHPNAKIQN